MDETELHLRKLELEHDDLLSQREVWHYAQWGVPIAIITAAIYAKWITVITDPSWLIVALVAWALNIWIAGIRQQKDAELDRKRREIELLMKKRES